MSYIVLPDYLKHAIYENDFNFDESDEILKYARFVLKEVQKYATNDNNFNLDLFQEGMKGLIKAREKYDKKKCPNFLGYARWWIKKYIQEFKYKDQDHMKIPGSFGLKMHMIKKELKKNPKITIKELSKNLGYKEKVIEECLSKLQPKKTSYEANLSNDKDDNFSLSGLLSNETLSSNFMGLSDVEIFDLFDSIKVALKKEPKDEQDMFYRHIYEGEPYHIIAKDYGISHMTVKNKINKIQKKLKPILDEIAA